MGNFIAALIVLAIFAFAPEWIGHQASKITVAYHTELTKAADKAALIKKYNLEP